MTPQATGHQAPPSETPIAALTPRGCGHQFVFYGDCCSGIAGGPFEHTFARVNAAVRRLDPPPEFLIFLGDHVMGSPADADSIRRQWDHWIRKEMPRLYPRQHPIYHVTGNHDTFDAASEHIWRETFSDIPANGPPGQTGLSYWVRRGDLLLVVVNTNFSGLGGYGHVESAWLDATLAAHSDARHKIVAGHHPAFPVNGYSDRPLWNLAQEDADAFWAVLVRHGVLAYLCSHIIAFDIQEHDGVLQICSGGAGTSYGPGGFMGEGEYHHFVQAALDSRGLRLQTVDMEGCVRERWRVSRRGGGAVPSTCVSHVNRHPLSFS